VAARIGISEPPAPPWSLAVLHEARPYEIGWLLYAFASQHSVSLPDPASDLSCSRT